MKPTKKGNTNRAPLQLNLSGVLFTHYFRLYKIYVTEQKPSKLIAGNIPLASISALILLNLTHRHSLEVSKNVLRQRREKVLVSRAYLLFIFFVVIIFVI